MRMTIDPVVAAETMLVEQGMPIEEVSDLLCADDPTTVRRHLELHRERLVERSMEQRRAVDDVERLLVALVRRPRAGQALRAETSESPFRKPMRQDG
jgi:hypothetical protein